MTAIGALWRHHFHGRHSRTRHGERAAGNGDGTFQAPRNFAVGSGPTSVAVGDFNNDGRPGLCRQQLRLQFRVGLHELGRRQLLDVEHLHFGNGAAGTLAAGDFNGDGVTDLAVPVPSFPPRFSA